MVGPAGVSCSDSHRLGRAPAAAARPAGDSEPRAELRHENCGSRAVSLPASPPSGPSPAAGSWMVNARKVIATPNMPSARLVRRSNTRTGLRRTIRAFTATGSCSARRSRPCPGSGDHHRFRRQQTRLALPFPQPVFVVAGAVHRDHLVVALRVDRVDRHAADQAALQRAHVLDRLADRIGDAGALLSCTARWNGRCSSVSSSRRRPCTRRRHIACRHRSRRR